MGQCKICGDIYGEHGTTEDICKNCLKPEDIAKKKTIEYDAGEIIIYKAALWANILSIVSFVASILGMALSPIGGFMVIIFFLSLIIGNILSLHTFIKFFKKKEYKKHMTKLMVSLVASDGLIVLALWLLKDANFHA